MAAPDRDPEASAASLPDIVPLLHDGLAGRKALLRAYETVHDRVDDAETREMLGRFLEEEREELRVAEDIALRHGATPGLVQGIRNEVAGILGRRAFSGATTGAYGTVRDLTILYGMEAAGALGAKAIQPLADVVGDGDWHDAVERSIERSRDHMGALLDRVEALSQDLAPVPDRL